MDVLSCSSHMEGDTIAITSKDVSTLQRYIWPFKMCICFNLQDFLHLLAQYVPAEIFLLTRGPHAVTQGPWTLKLFEQIERESEGSATAALYKVQ